MTIEPASQLTELPRRDPSKWELLMQLASRHSLIPKGFKYNEAKLAVDLRWRDKKGEVPENLVEPLQESEEIILAYADKDPESFRQAA